MAATVGYRFQRNMGASTEYAMPSTRLPTNVQINGSDPVSRPSARLRIWRRTTDERPKEGSERVSE